MRIGDISAGIALATMLVAGTAGAQTVSKITVIELTQVPCQIVESENGIDRGFKSADKTDCEAINAKSGESRLAAAKILKLKPGEYVFRVTNKNVPYPLGFWLRSEGYDWRNPLHMLSKTSVSGGGLATGTTRDYVVTLEPGIYEYSCPLNPTPDYKIIVEN